MAAARARGLAEPTAKPGFDAYAGMLVLSLLAMVVGIVLLLMDYTQYPDAKPQLPSASKAAPAPAGGAAPGGAAPGGAAPGGAAPGGAAPGGGAPKAPGT
jgi:hypothetical protein